jgi:hypothetical protein
MILDQSEGEELICCCGCNKKLTAVKDHTHKCHSYVACPFCVCCSDRCTNTGAENACLRFTHVSC